MCSTIKLYFAFPKATALILDDAIATLQSIIQALLATHSHQCDLLDHPLAKSIVVLPLAMCGHLVFN